jgi:two-component system nitrate/nitrite response regulator NarL
MSDQTKIILVDDHLLFRRGFTELLTRNYGMTIVGDTDNADELISLMLEHQTSLVVMDLNLEQTDGLGLLKRIRKEGLLTPVLILTMSDAQSDLANALRAGVRGYLLKSMDPEDVVDAIRRVAAGELVVAPSLTEKLVMILQNESQEQSGNHILKSLTARQREILQFLARGKSNKVIALKLGISAETVKQHIRNILTKLNLSSRVAAAVLFAVESKCC